MDSQSPEVRSIAQFIEYMKDHHQEDGLMFRGQQVDRPLLPRVARLIAVAGEEEEFEHLMLADFKRWAVACLDSMPADDWGWLSLAQHHGMATRLLDWTLNPLAALWFAVKREDRDSGRGVVWVFNPHRMTTVRPEPGPLDIQTVTVHRPTHVSRRIAAQGAVFTAHPRNASVFVPLEDDNAATGRLTKIVVPREQFGSLRWELDRCGVHSASLFPDLDGISRHIEWIHSVDDDEIELAIEHYNSAKGPNK